MESTIKSIATNTGKNIGKITDKNVEADLESHDVQSEKTLQASKPQKKTIALVPNKSKIAQNKTPNKNSSKQAASRLKNSNNDSPITSENLAEVTSPPTLLASEILEAPKSIVKDSPKKNSSKTPNKLFPKQTHSSSTKKKSTSKKGTSNKESHASDKHSSENYIEPKIKPKHRLYLPGNPLIVERNEHCISRKNIDPDALMIMRRLFQHGFLAFLVGGGVRDLLLNKKPKDYDIGTDARPEQIKKIFRNSRIIGRRFRINHIFFHDGKIMEVATFRSSVEATHSPEPLPASQKTALQKKAPQFFDDNNDHNNNDDDEDFKDKGSRNSAEQERLQNVNTLAKDNTWGDPQTDAIRRDLTINGLFYDPQTFCVIDYVGGMKDLHDKTIRVIGDPDVRFKEDPIRMLRAVRHAARTGFEIEKKTYKKICENYELIKLCPESRVYEEFTREFRGGSSKASLHLLYKTKLLSELFPELYQAIEQSKGKILSKLDKILESFDESKENGFEFSFAIIFLLLLNETLSTNDILDISAEELELLRLFLQEQSYLSEEILVQHPFILDLIEGRKLEISKVLQKIANQIFCPIGLPRAEREKIPQLLLSRFYLIVHLQKKYLESKFFLSRGVNIPNFSITRESLDFVEKTITEKKILNALDAFLIDLEKNQDINSSSPNPQKRKRRRRRKKNVE